MSDELSYVLDEENHESVHKTTISKLFAPKLRQTKLALQKSRENLRTLKMYHARKDSTANQLARRGNHQIAGEIEIKERVCQVGIFVSARCSSKLHCGHPSFCRSSTMLFSRVIVATS